MVYCLQTVTRPGTNQTRRINLHADRDQRIIAQPQTPGDFCYWNS